MTAWYRQPRIRAITLTGVGVLLVVIIVGALMLTAWQTSPVKTLFDAMDHARTSAGVYHITMSDGSDFEITSDGVLIGLKGNVAGVPMEGVVNRGDIYIRSSSSKDLFAMFLSNPDELNADERYNEHVRLIDNQWLHISADKIPTNSLAAALLSCTVTMRVNISDADRSKDSLRSAYSFHQFISIKSVFDSPNESTYKFMINKGKVKAFFEHLGRSEFGKKLSGCKAIHQRLGNVDDAEFVATVKKSDHTFRGMQVMLDDSEIIKITVDYSQKQTVEPINGGLDLIRMIDVYENLPPIPAGTRP